MRPYPAHRAYSSGIMDNDQRCICHKSATRQSASDPTLEDENHRFGEQFAALPSFCSPAALSCGELLDGVLGCSGRAGVAHGAGPSDAAHEPANGDVSPPLR
jgi:hypothetical protein